jgi:argininosuccinate lyase
LPLAYAKDMQEDKEPVFDALDALKLGIAAMTGMVEDMEPDTDALRAAAGQGFTTATDLADWLVRELKLPFREAHHVTGRIVAIASERGVELTNVTLAEMQAVHPAITDAVYSVLTVDKSVRSRTSYGGTSPKNVRSQAKRWQRALAREMKA